MSILSSTIVSILLSFVLAATFRFTGQGMHLGVLFSIFLSIILPLMLVNYTETEKKNPDGTTIKSPLVPKRVGNIVLGVAFLFLAWTWFPVVQAMAKNQSPMTFEAAGQLFMKNDITRAIYLYPLDIAQKAISYQVLKNSSAVFAKVTQNEYDTVPCLDPNSPNAAKTNAELETCLEQGMTVAQNANRVGSKLEGLRREILRDMAEYDRKTGTNWAEWFNPKSYMVEALEGTRIGRILTLLIMVFVICGFIQLTHFLSEKDAKQKSAHRRNMIMLFGLAFLTAFAGPAIAAEFATTSASIPGQHNDEFYSKVGYTSNESNCLNDGQLSIKEFFVRTGVMLYPGETANIVITEYTMYHHQGNRPDGSRIEIRPADANGYTGTPPINLTGAKICPECEGWNVMAVIGKIDDHSRGEDLPGLIGTGASMSSDDFGSGEIMLGLNMPIRKPDPLSNKDADNEMVMLSGKVCWEITKSGTRR